MQAAYPSLRPSLEKITGRIAVSEDARRTVTTHLGGDAVVIPNGVYVAPVRPTRCPRRRGPAPRSAPTIAFLGRIDEPRKGMPVLAAALPAVLAQYPGCGSSSPGPGDVEAARERLDPSRRRGRRVPRDWSATRTRRVLLSSVDLYVAPHTGGESFGIVLVEAMSAGRPVVASDLPAFVRVLDGGRAGATFVNEDPRRPRAPAACELLRRPGRSASGWARPDTAGRVFDWSVVAEDVMAVYETVTHGASRGRAPDAGRRLAVDPAAALVAEDG